MSLRERFTEAMKEAMKSGDKPRLSAVRLINSAVKDRDIEGRGSGKKEASEEEIVTLLQKMIKQRQESAALYDKGARPELAAQERAEIAVISSFLPQQLDEGEVAERDQGGDRRDRRLKHQGHGQGDGVDAGAPRRQDRFLQGRARGEIGPERIGAEPAAPSLAPQARHHRRER